jgi:hypothetical protein
MLLMLIRVVKVRVRPRTHNFYTFGQRVDLYAHHPVDVVLRQGQSQRLVQLTLLRRIRRVERSTDIS